MKANLILKSLTLTLFLFITPAALGLPSGPLPGPWPQSTTAPPAAPEPTDAAKKEALLTSAPATRAPETAKKPTKSWLTLSGEIRTRVEGLASAQFRSGNDDLFLLTRLRLDVDVHPTSWFRVFLQGQDAQAIGLKASPDPPLYQDTVDLRQAYVEVFDRERQGFGLRVGRQELAFGDERLIGGLNWTNTARSFDAVRFFYAKPKYRVDLFASSVVVLEDEVFDKIRDGSNFYGVYGSFQNLVPKATVEGYALWRTLPRVVDERGRAGDADVHTVGTRLVGNLPAQFDYKVELAGQRGQFAGDRVRAWALHSQVGYTASSVKTAPRWLLEYNFASGDRDPTDGRRQTFDQLFPTNHDKYGIADLVGWRNLHNLRAGVGASVTKKISAQVDYHSFWLASRRDAFYGVVGAPVARVATGAPSRHIGQEVDVYGTVRLMKSLTLGAGTGYLFAGEFVKQTTPGAGSGFSYGMLTYRF